MMKIIVSMFVLLLAGCSHLPAEIESAPTPAVQLKQVSMDSETYKGQAVRWGGKIIAIKNHQTFSEIQLVEFPLNYRARPVESTQSQGRFVIRSEQFLDPEIYQIGLMLTVTGTVQNTVTMQVDQKTLTLPVISLQNAHVWPKNNAAGVPYNPKHDLPFVGLGYYGTGSYSP